MSSTKNEDKCFTLTWSLENFSYYFHQKGEGIKSPEFVVDDIQGTTWNLMLYPEGKKDDRFLSYYLQRKSDSKGEEDEVEISYELTFLDKSGLELLDCETFSQFYSTDDDHGVGLFVERNHLFFVKRSEFLPEDTLTARCRIWKKCGSVTENVRCFARSRIVIEKRSFLWNLENFKSLELGKECIYRVKSVQKRSELISVNLSLIEGLNCEMIHFKVIRLDESIKYCYLGLKAIKSDESNVPANEERFSFESGDTQQFTFFFSRQRLCEMDCLSGDNLSLHFGCAFSKGTVSEEISKVECNCRFCVKD